MKDIVNIFAGEYMASKQPKIIKTVLGSCVAVCLFDPRRRIGGMNHILLPGKADMKHFDNAARYGVNAMELLINRMLNLGANRDAFVAKVFGGGNVLPGMVQSLRMGEKNSAFILEFLNMENIRIVGWDIGGHQSRKVIFHTDTGEVLLQRMDRHYSKKIIIQQEKKKAQVKREVEKGGGITWFYKKD